ncbi:MAG: MBL fold metallo-hydrolase [Deltaproteobacteria bacterium]|nr:MBL fold metallo-hydrolase [Deltaproteobacteria bacterium]
MLLPLFHQDVFVVVLASGSRGNCTYVGTERSGVLVDCGLGPTQTLARLSVVGLGTARIEGVLVTHEHSDHVGGAAVLDRALQKRQGELVPFWMTTGTARNLHERIVPRTVRTVVAGTPFPIGRIRVEPVSVPHDVPDPVCYTLEIGRTRVGVITDLGRSTRLVERQLSTMDVAVLEFNHDPELLLDGSYPWSLKQRIRGNHGHLSNAQAADLVAAGASSRLRHLLLAHLSDENNRPVLAEEAAHHGLSRAGYRGVTVAVGRQREPLPAVRPEADTQQATKNPVNRVPRINRRIPGASPAFPSLDEQHRQGRLFG